jgi:hypothetical protein
VSLVEDDGATSGKTERCPLILSLRGPAVCFDFETQLRFLLGMEVEGAVIAGRDLVNGSFQLRSARRSEFRTFKGAKTVNS